MKKRVLTAIGIAIFTLAAYAQWSNPANDIPAYNAAPPKGALPPIMAGKELTGRFGFGRAVHQTGIDNLGVSAQPFRHSSLIAFQPRL